MPKVGFFTRDDARQPRKRSTRKRQQVSDDTLRKMGPAGVKHMNPDAESPEMPPTGSKAPLVYVLGEAPGEEEDRQGKPFVGPSGKMLRNAIGWGVKRTRFDNVVRTRPPNNRKPTREEVECFRSVVSASIEDAEPLIVLGVGGTALEWATGRNKIKAAMNKMFPIRVGEHECWFVPVLHPSFLMRIQDKREDKVPGREWEYTWRRRIEDIYQLAEDDTLPVPEVVSDAAAQEGIVRCKTLKDVEIALDELSEEEAVGWDWETHGLRPYAKGSRILSCALSDGERSYAFPIDHDQARWSKKDRARLLDMLREFMVQGPSKVSHNLPFEMEWCIHLLGTEVVEPKNPYHCSMQAAYVLDPGPPGEGAAGHSLDFLCFQKFGFDLKKLTFAGSWRNRLREMSLDKLLDYNALDAKWHVNLWDVLMEEVEEEGLQESYERQIQRVVPIVLAQREGVPTDQEESRRLQEQFEKRISVLEEEIRETDAVNEYERTHGKFNPASPADVGKLLGGVMGLASVRTESGGYTTGAKVLDKLKDKNPIVAKILEFRSMSKLKGTYVDKFLPDHPQTNIYPDGLIHCQFGITKTRTARLSSEDPNNQNWPKRKHKEVRAQLAAPGGYVYVAVDQGQVEARVLAMESKDPRWVQMIKDDYDIHAEYAEKLVEIKPSMLEEYGSLKGVRHPAKNGMVFPAFYGSSVKSIIYNLGLPERPALEMFEEFWETFEGIKAWQDEMWDRYRREGCVWSLTGRRRLGPLSRNMAVNTPIQTTASDICEDANDRLSVIARRENKPWLQSRLLIHDDLTFLMPEEEVEEGIIIVVREQLGFKADWINVPLSVEVEVGPNLNEMEPVGTWRSDEV